MVSEEYGPLLTLARKLQSVRPRSLSMLLSRFVDIDDYKEFVRIVKEFLPERELEILRLSSCSEQIAAFYNHFGIRYFPLDEAVPDMAEEDDYEFFVYRIPVQLMGTGYEDYHEITEDYWRDGIRLLTYLSTCPYVGEAEARIPLGVACLAHVPAALLQRVPEGGWEPGELHRLLDGTDYEGAACWADILNQNTGTGFLDVSRNDEECCEMPFWDREEVECLTLKWQWAELIQSSVYNLVDWLELDMPKHFREIIDYLEGKKNDEPDARQGELALDFTGVP